MGIYISLLRGINVSGKNKILMADLKIVYESLSFKNVTTYIQSGNVIFESPSAKKLEEVISNKIKEAYGFEVPVLVKNMEEFLEAVSSNPFLKEKNIELDKLHLTFLSSTPATTTIDKIKDIKTEDRYSIVGPNVYLYCPIGYGNTKLNNTLLEKKLEVKATTRNWKTCNEIIHIVNTKYLNK